jgi:ribosomal protein S18 acetylase RimI-like enzyme
MTLPARQSAAAIKIRTASLDDLNDLVDLENRCFETDKLNRRQFRHLLTKGNAAILVADDNGKLLGNVVVLFSRGTSMARLYSIAVAPEARGKGIARAMVEAAEAAAHEHECAYMRLEIRKDNQDSIGLFTRLGYHRFGELSDYYDDHMDAWRYEKTLSPGLLPELATVPYYEQTLDFTCGPASLMMAMKALKPEMPLNRKLELRLWREATTIYMTSGHGGCGPFGLGLAAAQRGFDVEIFVSDKGVLLIDTVRNDEKKTVMQLVQDDMLDEIKALGIPVHYHGLKLEDIQQAFDSGAIPLVLISSWQIYHERFPHWVVVTGFDERFVYVNDPFVDYEYDESVTDSINMPIPRRQFERMSRYGKTGLKAVIFIRQAQNSKPRKSGRRKTPSI